MRYEFRHCTEEHRDWAYALKSEAYRDVVERQFGPWDEKFQRELFAARWNPKISRIILYDKREVGLLAMEERSDGLWLDEIQIARAWRGWGLGSLIIRDLIRQQPLRLQVLKQNARALQFYTRLKFGMEGETQTHYLMRHPGIISTDEET